MVPCKKKTSSFILKSRYYYVSFAWFKKKKLILTNLEMIKTNSLGFNPTKS